MFNFDAFTSSTTAGSWSGVGTGKPFALSLSVLISSIVTVIVSIVLNITSANEPGNDYGEGTGWVVMMPGPAVTLVWSVICLVLCKFSHLSPALALGSYLIITLGLIGEGITTALLYEWHEIAWLPAVFILLLAINTAVFVGCAIAAVRKRNNAKHMSLDA